MDIKLPQSIVDIILEYDGRIHNRSGKYIDRIHKNDHRYHLLSTLPKIVFSHEFYTNWYIKFSNKQFVLQKFVGYYPEYHSEFGEHIKLNDYHDNITRIYSYIVINGDRYEFIKYGDYSWYNWIWKFLWSFG